MVAEKVYDLLPKSLPKFIGDLPSTDTNVVALLEYDGATSTEFFGMKDVSSLYHPIVKIIIRNKSYSEAQAWVEQIKTILHRHHDAYFLSVLLVGSPMYLGRSVMKLHEFQVTFRTEVKE